MIPIKIELENWMCFRGKHTRKLQNGVYAIVASRETSPESSNWAGKSSFASTVPFALFGQKPKQCRLEDDWITRGEKQGSVKMTLSDGTIIERSRKRKSSTKITVTFEEGGESLVAEGDAAQSKIIELIGMSQEDYFATCHLAQKEMARFVTCEPADRMKVIGEWLDLAPLQRCNQNVNDRLAELLSQDDETAKQIAVLEDSRKRLEQGDAFDYQDPKKLAAPIEAISLYIKAKSDEVDQLRANQRELQEEIDNHADWIVTSQTATEYEQLVEQGKALAKKLKMMKPAQLEARYEETKEKLAEQTAELKAAELKLAEAKRNAAGRFDGTCPIIGDSCPVEDDIRKQVAKSAKVKVAAEQQCCTARQHRQNAMAPCSEIESYLNEARKLNTQLLELRKRAKVMKPAWDEIQRDGQPPDITEQRDKLDEAQEKTAEAQAALLNAKRMLKQLEDLNLEIGLLEDARRLNAKKIATHREALAVFGRRGAQRVKAEGSLAMIEAGANACLGHSAGIDLSVEVQWSRPAASGLAKVCEACGEPFPASQKPKECQVCGEVRGPHRIEKLELQLSDSSGAADDLVGIAFQLGASSYLRRERGSQWSAAIIDEPFSALDAENRRLFARRLAPMLQSTFGFEQALVITHDRAVVDALPDRVEIVAGEMGSRLV